MKERSRQDLRSRTKAFALRVIKLYTSLPKTPEAQVLGKAATPLRDIGGAHYHEACRSRSSAEFVSKIEGGLQELEETIYWLELIGEANIFDEDRLRPLHQEAEELIAMFVTMVKKVKQNSRAGARGVV